MKDDLFRNNLKYSTITHACLVLGLLVASVLSSCPRWRKPKEQIIMVDLTVALPPPPADEPAKPEPPKPEPVKIPDPPKQDIPEQKKEPPKPKPPEPPKPKKVIERSTNRVVRKDIPVAKVPPKGPVLSPEEIKKLLAAGARISDTTSVPDNWEVTGYYQKVGDRIRRVWAAQSDALPAGFGGQVSLKVLRNGSITEVSIKQTSGNSTVDQSLLKAVRSIHKLDPLPDKMPGASADIVVYFDTDRMGGL